MFEHEVQQSCEHEIQQSCGHEIDMTQDMPMYIYLPLDTSKLDNAPLLDANDFAEGVQNASYLAGQITALANVGVSPEAALEFFASKILNAENIQAQKDMADINNNANITIAKFNGETQMRQML